MSQTTNRIIKNTGFLYAKMGITMFISLWTTRLILNALGTTDFGIYGIVGGAIAMLGFLNGSMAGATQRFMSYSQGENDLYKQKQIFNNSLILHWAISVVVVILLEMAYFPLFHGVLNIPDGRYEAATIIYHFFVTSTFFTIISVPYDAAINAHEDMGYYAIVGIVESFSKLFIAMYIVYTGQDKLILYGFLMALLAIFLLFIKYRYCKRKYVECTVCVRKYSDSSTIRNLTSFAGWNFVGLTGGMVGINGGEVVMNHYFGPSVNAAGSVSVQIREQLMSFSNVMLKAASPAIVKKEGGGDRKGMIQYTISGGKLAYVLFALLALPSLIETPYILRLWLKNVPEWAVCFTRIQILLGLTLPFFNTLSTALSASGSIKANCIFSCIMHLVPLAIFIIIYNYGAEPYWTYLIVSLNYAVVLNGYLLYQCHLHCGLDIYSYIRKSIVPCFICSLMSLSVGWLIFHQMTVPVMRLLLVIVIVDLSFLFFAYYLLFDKKEKEAIRSVISFGK